jgi:integrase/recombinase XerD
MTLNCIVASNCRAVFIGHHAMKMDDSGDSLRLLQEHLGHASFNTAAKYLKIAGDEHREWYDKLWQK